MYSYEAVLLGAIAIETQRDDRFAQIVAWLEGEYNRSRARLFEEAAWRKKKYDYICIYFVFVITVPSKIEELKTYYYI